MRCILVIQFGRGKILFIKYFGNCVQLKRIGYLEIQNCWAKIPERNSIRVIPKSDSELFYIIPKNVLKLVSCKSIENQSL